MKRISISGVKFSNRYKSISMELGYDANQYVKDLVDLYQLWNTHKYIDIYEDNLERSYGRAKDSNSTPGSTPFYIDLYHARVLSTQGDPLVVLELEEQDNLVSPILVIKFLVHHDDIFGTQTEKNNRQIMLGIRKRIDAYRQEDKEDKEDNN